MQVIKLAAQVARRETIPADHWAHVTIRVHYASRVRPDLDNAIKTVLDALTGVAWVDDRQVERLDAKIAVGDRDCLLVIVNKGVEMKKARPSNHEQP
jgi:Holliday junction resolvase RusA-like endonuclease